MDDGNEQRGNERPRVLCNIDETILDPDPTNPLVVLSCPVHCEDWSRQIKSTATAVGQLGGTKEIKRTHTNGWLTVAVGVESLPLSWDELLMSSRIRIF